MINNAVDARALCRPARDSLEDILAAIEQVAPNNNWLWRQRRKLTGMEPSPTAETLQVLTDRGFTVFVTEESIRITW